MGLYKHQILMLDFYRKHFRCGNWSEMGTGKTAPTLMRIAELFDQKTISRALIVCPLSLVDTWINEALRWTPKLKIIPLSGDSKKRRGALEFFKSGCFVINYEGLRILKQDLASKKFELIAFDEATRIKNGQAKQTKAAHALADKADFVILMTGTPITNNLLDVWSLWRGLDQGKRFGRWFTHFRSKHFHPSGYQGHDWKPNQETPAVISRALEEDGVRFRKKDCLDLPPKIYCEPLTIELSPDQRRVYDELKTQLISEYDGGIITVNTAITKLLRLSQITGGFFPQTEADKVIKAFSPNRKLDAILDFTQDVLLSGEKIIIWARFIAEIEALLQAFTRWGAVAIYGAVSQAGRAEAMQAFQNDPETRVFIGQQHTAGFGLTLTAASTIIYYSNDYSIEARLQSEDRAHRIGQKGERVNYYDLVAKNTVDAAVMRALRNKKSLSDLVVDGNGIKQVVEGL